MIALRRINGQEFVLNADLIETMESTPDTVLTLTNGKKIIVQNSLEEIVRKTIKYKQLCNQGPQVIKKDGSRSNPEQ
ncbi:MAG: flagellar FlbD family protein [Fibrobacter sp.]|nr:flagellar FlbD family protein [Fibrobacter sp.]HON12131.1 flagellar FlbD family protein [Chitinispirillaceae bacterium]